MALLTRIDNLPINLDSIWEAVQQVQDDICDRKIDKQDVSLFFRLCTDTLKICKAYNLEEKLVEIEVTGGAKEKKHTSITKATILHASADIDWDEDPSNPIGVTVSVYRALPKKDPFAYGDPHGRIRIKNEHPLRPQLEKAGLLNSESGYIQIFPEF